MIVSELIEKLQGVDPNSEIWFTYIEDGYQEVTTERIKVDVCHSDTYGNTVEFKALDII